MKNLPSYQSLLVQLNTLQLTREFQQHKLTKMIDEGRQSGDPELINQIQVIHDNSEQIQGLEGALLEIEQGSSALTIPKPESALRSVMGTPSLELNDLRMRDRVLSWDIRAYEYNIKGLEERIERIKREIERHKGERSQVRSRIAELEQDLEKEAVVQEAA